LFTGTYSPRLDEKGRIILPAKFRRPLADGLVIAQGPEHCLRLFPLEEFQRYAEKMQDAPMRERRVVFAAASEEQPDRQGRVTIPPTLRRYAGLTRECAVNGNITHVEIWDAATWERYREAQEGAFATLEEETVTP
jgi:MraZ protein